MIIAFCVSALPDKEVRRIDEVGVFMCTAMFSLLVLCAYVLDRHWCPCQSKVQPEDGDEENGSHVLGIRGSGTNVTKEQVRMELKRLNFTEEQLENGDNEAVAAIAERLGSAVGKQKWTIARARMTAVKAMTGSKRVADMKAHETATNAMVSAQDDSSSGDGATVGFSSATYAVREDEGHVNIIVYRTGDLSCECSIDYATADGTATAVEDYMPAQGTLTFQPGATQQRISVEIIDDDVYEPDEVFTVTLSAPNGCSINSKLKTCVVTIIDDDVPGVISFDKNATSVGIADDDFVEVQLVRQQGCDGTIQCDVFTIEGDQHNTAQPDVHYQPVRLTVEFTHNESSKKVKIPLLPEAKKDSSDHLNFFAHIDNPTGGSKIGKKNKINVLLTNDAIAAMIANIQDRLEENREKYEIGTHSWHQRFIDAITAEGDEDDDDGSGAPPGVFDIVAHILSLPWKVIFAFCPPTDYCQGKLTFITSLACIGAVTALVEQIGKMMGCVAGIPQEITSITIVALGTSLPDTFASMIAAKEDDNADASGGNVTGSNSVNVFLGLGLPWTIACLYYGESGYPVAAGGLNFMVTLFVILAVTCIFFLMLRRQLSACGKAELGGPKATALASSMFLASLWITFVVVSSLYMFKLI